MARALLFVLRVSLKCYRPAGQGVRFQEQMGETEGYPDKIQNLIHRMSFFLKLFIEITDGKKKSMIPNSAPRK